MSGAHGGHRDRAGNAAVPPEPGTAPRPLPRPEGATAAATEMLAVVGSYGGGAGDVRDGRAPYPGSGGSWCFWRRGRAALLLPWGPGGALSRGLKRAGLAKA